MDVTEVGRKLGARLPLGQRQSGLGRGLRELHRSILRSFHERGFAPRLADLGEEKGAEETARAVRTLEENDLVVRDDDGEIVGAYPFTTAHTPHRLSLEHCSVNAMCALDALGVAPMFGPLVTIDSTCEVTGEPIHITQNARELVDAQPSPAIHVGIRWKAEKGAAADTL